MTLDRITLREIRMPLVHFFETSFGRTTERRILLVEVQSDGISGWGEVPPGRSLSTTKNGPMPPGCCSKTSLPLNCSVSRQAVPLKQPRAPRTSAVTT
jgi:hypothetical protein